MLRPFIASVVFLALDSAAAAQRRTWVVDSAGGPGVDFTQIQPAVDTARPGDRVEVRGQATYQSFTLAKGLDVEAVAGASVPSVGVVGVPMSEWARVAGFQVGSGAPADVPLVLIQDCPGPVTLVGCQVGSFFLFTWRSLTATIVRCGAVLVLDSSVSGARSVQSFQPGGAGLDVRDSQVTLQRSGVVGGLGSQGFLRAGTNGGQGLIASNSNLFAVRSTFSGGSGGAGYSSYPNCGSFPPGAGGQAVNVSGLLLCMERCQLLGGAGGGAGVGCPPAPAGAAVVGRARVTSDCVVSGAASGVVVIPPLPGLVTPTLAQRGGIATFSATGQPGTVTLLYLDAPHGHLQIPGIDGPLLLSLAAIPLPLVVVGGSGSTPFWLPVPLDPELANQMFFLQGVAFEPQAVVPSLTNPGDLRVR